MADKISDWIRNAAWELLLKTALIGFPIFATSIIGLFVWTIKQIHGHDTEIRALRTEWAEHGKMTEEYKTRLRVLEQTFVEFRVSQEQMRGDVRQVDQSVRTLNAQLELQTRQLAAQAERSADLREKMLSVQVATDQIIANLHANTKKSD